MEKSHEIIDLRPQAYRVYTIIVGKIKTQFAALDIEMLQNIAEGRPSIVDDRGEEWDALYRLDTTIIVLLTASHKVAAKLPGEVARVTMGKMTPIHIYDSNVFAITITKILDNGRKYHIVLGLTLENDNVDLPPYEKIARLWVEAIAKYEDNVPVEELATKAATILAKGISG